jgi:hypothetical protein
VVLLQVVLAFVVPFQGRFDILALQHYNLDSVVLELPFELLASMGPIDLLQVLEFELLQVLVLDLQRELLLHPFGISKYYPLV